MGSVPSKGKTFIHTTQLQFQGPPKKDNESEESKNSSSIDPKKLEIGEYFLEKYLFLKRKKLHKNVKKWDAFLKKMQKYKGSSSSPSNSCHSSLTFDPTLIQIFFKTNRGKFLSKINHSPGPPMKYRFLCWKTILNIPNGYVDYGFTRFRKQKSVSEVDRDIKKDLHRTYPTQQLFLFRDLRDNNEFTLGERQLCNVLRAIANNFPRIGYCQGMNFVVGFLLLISGGNENDAFGFFSKMGLDSRFHVLGLFENNFPLVNLYCFMFWRLMKERDEELKIHLERMGVPDHAWISKWFMMLFLYSLPLDLICRVWDFILSEESLTSALKVATALMRILKPDLMKFDEIFEIMEYFKILKGGLYEPYQSVYLVGPSGKNQRIGLQGDILVRQARKIKLPKKWIGDSSRQFIKENPQFETHILIKYYARMDSIEAKELKIFEEEMRKYYTTVDESKPRKTIRTLSFENLPALTDDDEFLGVNKLKKIPVFDVNSLVIFGCKKEKVQLSGEVGRKMMKIQEKNDESDDDDEIGSSSDEDFPTTNNDKISEKKYFD